MGGCYGTIRNLCSQILIPAANYIKNKIALDLAKSTAPGPKPSAQYVHKRLFDMAFCHIKPMQSANINCLMMIMSLESEALPLHLSSHMTTEQLAICHLCPKRQSALDNSCPTSQPPLDVNVSVNC